MKGAAATYLLGAPVHLELANWVQASDIHRPEVNLVIIEERLSQQQIAQAHEIVRCHGQDQVLFHKVVRPDREGRLSKNTRIHISLKGAPELSKTINQTLQGFSQLDPGRGLKIELSVVFKQACWLFHTDKVRLRLIQTLLGRGTEWLPESFLNRQGLGKGDNDRIVTKWSEVRSMPAPSIGLLKGDSYPGNMGRGLVHRSPLNELVRTDGRLVLKVDSFE